MSGSSSSNSHEQPPWCSRGDRWFFFLGDERALVDEGRHTSLSDYKMTAVSALGDDEEPANPDPDRRRVLLAGAGDIPAAADTARARCSLEALGCRVAVARDARCSRGGSPGNEAPSPDEGWRPATLTQ
jgi:hypothetical protein